MNRLTTIAEVRTAVAAARADGARVALVPTMGALHEGHLELVREAARRADVTIVSVFVNPTQFDRPDDLEDYPRDLAGDETQLAALGDAAPRYVFAPDVAEVYPRTPITKVTVTELTDRLCSASRPGHFDGVATVCTKLFSIVQPDLAVFGRKDHQQLTIIRRVALDLDLPVDIVGAATVREPDGLAMSSRNRRLSPQERDAALALSRSLRDGVEAARAARADGLLPVEDAVRAAVEMTLAAAPEVGVDYVEVVDPDTLAPLPADPGGGSAEVDRLLVAVAAFVGPVRLIDNVVVGDTADEDRLVGAVGRGT